ncbi:hypothetical protein QTG54_000965 [Skeletonema marinoi]|uniref:UBX domain-containing protein n=1 Tax=Skeletonema marinoi TaxID=267567 RepID=A0AAD8YPX0_9STRA|nr:hypothetical protein QTG54_000965 [Skeletonema marinoi]
MMDQGLPKYWWKEEDLLKGKTNAMTRADDPWKDVGSGRRLDGGKKSSVGAGQQSKPISEMSEEEMLQMAMEASLEQAPQNNVVSYPLTDEPAVGVKIQFRMPDGTRAVRKFLESDVVGLSIHMLVANQMIEMWNCVQAFLQRISHPKRTRRSQRQS